MSISMCIGWSCACVWVFLNASVCMHIPKLTSWALDKCTQSICVTQKSNNNSRMERMVSKFAHSDYAMMIDRRKDWKRKRVRERRKSSNVKIVCDWRRMKTNEENTEQEQEVTNRQKEEQNWSEFVESKPRKKDISIHCLYILYKQLG